MANDKKQKNKSVNEIKYEEQKDLKKDISKENTEEYIHDFFAKKDKDSKENLFDEPSNNKKKIILFVLFLLLVSLVACYIIFRPNLTKAASSYVDDKKLDLKEKLVIDATDLENDGYKTGLSKDCLKESYIEITKNNDEKLVYKEIKICSDTKPTITLKGDKNLTLKVGNLYTEEGYLAMVGSKDITSRVTSNINDLDINKIGIYKIKYVVIDKNGNKAEITRTIEVIDDISPVILLNGNKVTELYVTQKYTEKGAKATDNYDGDVTDLIIISGEVNTLVPGDYTITYKVNDSSDNESVTTRTVRVKKIIDASIKLNDKNIINHSVNTSYVDPGFTAYDVIMGDITDKVKVTSNVDITKLGTYNVTYEVTGTTKNKVKINRTVNVVDNVKPVIKLNGSEYQLLYLNIDTYTEKGAIATDNYDLDVNVIISGEVDITKSGIYYITYTATDKAGNTSVKVKTVEVKYKEFSLENELKNDFYVNLKNKWNLTFKISSENQNTAYYRFTLKDLADKDHITIAYKELGVSKALTFDENGIALYGDLTGFLLNAGDGHTFKLTSANAKDYKLLVEVVELNTNRIISFEEITLTSKIKDLETKVIAKEEIKILTKEQFSIINKLSSFENKKVYYLLHVDEVAKDNVIFYDELDQEIMFDIDGNAYSNRDAGINLEYGKGNVFNIIAKNEGSYSFTLKTYSFEDQELLNETIISFKSVFPN